MGKKKETTLSACIIDEDENLLEHADGKFR
jgi:hypothetical protein